MSAAPSISSPVCAAVSDTYRQITALYAEGNGWVSVWYCEGNPAAPNAQLYQYSWHHATEWNRIVADVQHCAARYGDVYVSLTQHSEPRRQERTAIACLWLWIDDIRNLALVTDAAMVLETSPANYQAFYRLSRALSAKERRMLQRRGRVALGGDPASADPVKPVRVAGGFNSKAQSGERNSENHQVRLVWLNDSVISPEELCACWPDVVGGLDGGEVTEIAEPRIEMALGNIDAHRERARRTVKPTSIAAMTLKDPASAPTPSEARYRVVYGLVSVGFLDHEIAALILYWTERETLPRGKQRSVRSLVEDVARCIRKALPKIEESLAARGRTLERRPTGGGYQRSSAPLRRPRVRVGLQHLSAGEYLAWVHAHATDGVLAMTVDAVVTALADEGIVTSRTTVERRERELAEAGHMQRMHGRLVLSGVAPSKPVIIAPPSSIKSVIISHMTDLENVDSSHHNALLNDEPESIETQPPQHEGVFVFLRVANDGLPDSDRTGESDGAAALPAVAAIPAVAVVPPSGRFIAELDEAIRVALIRGRSSLQVLLDAQAVSDASCEIPSSTCPLDAVIVTEEALLPAPTGAIAIPPTAPEPISEGEAVETDLSQMSLDTLPVAHILFSDTGETCPSPATAMQRDRPSLAAATQRGMPP